ncbi:DUF2075 domain-containing protein [Helicobacter cholecystus]|uniref:DNA 3'-5' helicase II n=1 Tax=Helicobacter cholecystus TaxID=45498 RepID=A0A3D8IZ27_9HELI|nr:UvrD-helicase domain-containing protein [Helicobacter cholecystus]RDU69884.1 DUF2075 domain-containing protein [Helicobacter cholecystus]VEJ25090.1 Superfamily I DNA and RNA helicases [Helicobacter cholecystus]
MRFIYHNTSYSLTEGEEFIFNFLNQTLPLEYDLYIQPNLQGNRPDMILFHKEQGIFIIEVKDWKLDRFFKKENAFFKREKDSVIQIINPASQIERYVFVCKNLFESIPITTIGYFHNAKSQDIESFFQVKGVKFFGFDNFKTIKEHILQAKSYEEIDEKKVRNILIVPLHKKEEGERLKLTQQQKTLITHTPNSWRRVKGVAGAGKTIVITQKAASIASNQKRVLILCFNKTLKSYIKENIARSQEEFDWNLIECHYFHEFLKLFIDENGAKVENGRGFEQYEKNMLLCANTLLSQGENAKSRKYDAILIDEAQDFKKEWFDFLLKFLSENDEVLLVADDKQNIYNREISWINESMAGCGYKFKGVWGILKDNIRQRKFPEVIEESNRFFELFLKDFLQAHPDRNFGIPIKCENIQKTGPIKRLFKSVDLFWKNTQEIKQSFLSAYQYLMKRGYKNKNIVVLVLTSKSGLELKEFLESENIGVKTYFDAQSKEGFMQKDENLKILTLHSFKGLENGVVIYISDGKEDQKNDFETYVAITRATECLIVLNTKERYREYGQGWKKYF